MSNFTSEQSLLLNILNSMYNDNFRQINTLYESINTLNESNIQIRNLIFQIMNIQNNSFLTTNNRQQSNNNSFENENLSRILINNIPYIIDNISEYRIPLNNDISENFQNNVSQLLQNFLQPIEIFPTPTQIELSTRQVAYCDIISPLNRSCPISLENFNESDIVTIIRYCGHIFKTDEINRWFRSNCRCPVCRYDIRNYSNTENPLPNSNTENSLPNSNTENPLPNSNTENSLRNIGRNFYQDELYSNYRNTEYRNSNNFQRRNRNRNRNNNNDFINIFTDLSGNIINNNRNQSAITRLFNSLYENL